MTPREHGPRPADAGFVLVGVVIFVLALTIIGLSLFRLSSYEAQFLQRSLDREQAFQSALGGIERAKFVLSVPPYRLDRVWQDLPRDRVIAATAFQMKGGVLDSTGPVQWQGEDVVLRVTAQVNGDSLTIESRFSPRLTQNYYAKVITTSREIHVDDFAVAGPGAPLDRRYTVNLGGAVWEGVSPPDFSTWEPLLLTPPDSIRTTPVPTPDLATYFTSHPVSAATPAPYSALTHTYQLTGPQNDARYFCAPSGHSRDDFYYNTYAGGEVYVTVQGLVVWEFPKGLRFDGTLHVLPLPGGSGCLVIVAGQAGLQPAPENDPQLGVRLFAGLRVEAGVSVIIVSNGRVYIQHMNNPSGVSSTANDITIYAQNAWLTGPMRYPLVPPAKHLTLNHLVTGDLDNRYIDLLTGLGALPNSSSASGRSFAFLPGSWHASDR